MKFVVADSREFDDPAQVGLVQGGTFLRCEGLPGLDHIVCGEGFAIMERDALPEFPRDPEAVCVERPRLRERWLHARIWREARQAFQRTRAKALEHAAAKQRVGVGGVRGDANLERHVGGLSRPRGSRGTARCCRRALRPTAVVVISAAGGSKQRSYHCQYGNGAQEPLPSVAFSHYPLPCPAGTCRHSRVALRSATHR